MHHLPKDATDEELSAFLKHDPVTLKMKAAVDQFHAVCRQHRQMFWKDVSTRLERDMVCLVVPSTETRVLSTLGVDVWDAGAQLPVLLITDQRFGGTRRYYLDDEEGPSAEDFVAAFWNDRLMAEVQSDPRGARTNRSGVRILTAASLDEMKGKHALVLFTVSTCGHCKRVSTIWNRLSELLSHVGWDSVLTLYRVDVSVNDLAVVAELANATLPVVTWVPDAYYLSPNRDWVRYSGGVGEKERGVGTVHDAMDVLEWLVHDVPSFHRDEAVREVFTDFKKTYL
jgi:hypothetical protein